MILGAHRNSFCFSPHRKAVSENVLKFVRVSVVEASVLLVEILGKNPIVVQREDGELRDSEARDHKPAASISDRCRIRALTSWYLRSPDGAPYCLVLAAVCVTLTEVLKIWQ